MSEDLFSNEEMKEAVRRNIKGLTNSKVFTAIFSDNYEKDIQAIMQFGLAVLMNKPIFLLVPRSREPSICENVKRLARCIEYVEDWNNQDEINRAAVRLMGKAKEMGFM